MPGFDGTGPRGQGPMTGRGEGYCAIPLDRTAQAPYGYVGLRGRPVPLFRRRWMRWFRPFRFYTRAFGRRRGRGFVRGRGRGRRR
jgi:hypothetical protein